MADENKDVTTTETTEEQNDVALELAQAKADLAKMKLTLDKTLKEKGEVTKALRAKQTAEERDAEEKAEADRAREAELEEVKKELNHMKAVSAYKELSDEKVVEALIDAVSDADHAAIANILSQEVAKAVKVAQAEWMKSRPQVSSGDYASMSVDEIMAIPDREERHKAMAQNIHLFEK